MYGQLVVYRVREDLRIGVGSNEIEHDLGRLRAAYCRQPGHRAGYVLRTSSGSVVVVNIFENAAAAGLADQVVASLRRDLLRDGRLEVVLEEEGDAADAKWSLTRRAIAGARQRERAYDRLVSILLADPDALSRSGSLSS